MEALDHKEGKLLCTLLGCPLHGMRVVNLRRPIITSEAYLIRWCAICQDLELPPTTDVEADRWKRPIIPWKERPSVSPQ